MTHIVDTIKQMLWDVVLFSQHASKVKLRHYQEAVAKAVVESVRSRKGMSFVVMFPRQSGKNELQAQIEAYLLAFLALSDAEIVKVSPTWKPQTLNAMRRLQRVLENNLITRGMWLKESGYIYRFNRARIFFFSGSPEANIVGATASTLLEVDEAQDIEIAKFDKDIAPMAASTNATRVFWGTAWTSRTLLARELRAAREAEKLDGQQRTFVLTAPEVALEVPAYGEFVNNQVARLGRSNPMVRTQYFSEEIDAEGGMFPPARVALMQGSHAAVDGPLPGCIYCILVDVAGEDEGVNGEPGELSNPGRDSTALTIVQVDLTTLADPIIKAPSYLVVARRQWIGVKHVRLYAEIKALAEAWRCRWLVIDATGIGAGLASFLVNALPGKVLPFVFNSKTKSELGWSFLGVIDSGRWKDHALIPLPSAPLLSAPLPFPRGGAGGEVGEPGSYPQGDQMNRAKVLDWGSYVRWDGKVIIPFARLVQLGLCDVFITKGGQSGPGLSTKANLAAARGEKVSVTGCFYWGDPCNSPEYDAAFIDALVIEEDPDIIILDFEQWWSDWAKYEAACSGLIGWGDVPHFTPFELSEHYRKVAQAVKADNPTKKVLIYTSNPFVVSWASPMGTWLHEFDGGFVASWPDYGKAVYYLDWDAIAAYPAVDCVPNLPQGWSTWSLWQTSSRIRPKEYQLDFASGFDHNYDWGLFNGSVKELLVWVGKPMPESTPEPTQPIIPPLTWQEAIDAWARILGYAGPAV